MAKLGQHFLRNAGAAKKIVDALDIKKDKDIIVEVGPGHGEITELIRKKEPKAMFLMEKDEELQVYLEQRLLDDPKINILKGDALTMLADFSERPGMAEYGWKLVGNIPYYITGHLLWTIGELHNKPDRCLFMVQKEVAERIVARPPAMNRLAAAVQSWAAATIVMSVPRRNFSPPPNVDSAVVLLETKSGDLDGVKESYERALHALFAQPRKTILNNLVESGFFPDGASSKSHLSNILANIGIGPTLRPQNLSIGDIAKIAKTLFGSA